MGAEPADQLAIISATALYRSVTDGRRTSRRHALASELSEAGAADLI